MPMQIPGTPQSNRLAPKTQATKHSGFALSTAGGLAKKKSTMRSMDHVEADVGADVDANVDVDVDVGVHADVVDVNDDVEM